MRLYTLVFLALPLALVACNPTQFPDGDLDPVSVTEITGPMPLGQVDADPESPHFLPFGAVERREAFREMAAAAGPAQADAHAILKQELPLDETDRRMREVFNRDLPQDARWLLQTTFGMRMLRRLLADPESDPEAIAFYADRLARYENPNADVLFAAIDRAGAHLTAERRAEARAQVEAGALDWLRRSACETCRTRSALRDRYPDGDGLDERNRAILDALSD